MSDWAASVKRALSFKPKSHQEVAGLHKDWHTMFMYDPAKGTDVTCKTIVKGVELVYLEVNDKVLLDNREKK